MKTFAEELFDKTISDYNNKVSDFHKFKFSQKEKEIFMNMMKVYGKECAKASLDKVSKGPSFYKINDSSERIYSIKTETITNAENIIIL